MRVVLSGEWELFGWRNQKATINITIYFFGNKLCGTAWFCPGVSNLWASLGHTGRRRVVSSHTLNTQTLAKIDEPKKGCFFISYFLFLKYISLILLLQLSHFFHLFIPLHPAPTPPPAFPHLSSCPWVLHISSLASPFPTLFLTSPYFVPTIYASYSLYLYPIALIPLPTDNPPCDLHFCILFLFQLFA